MMNQPLRRVDPLARSAALTETRPTAPRTLEPMTGSVWPICGGSVRAIVDTGHESPRSRQGRSSCARRRLAPPARIELATLALGRHLGVSRAVAQEHDGGAQLVRGHVRVALRGRHLSVPCEALHRGRRDASTKELRHEEVAEVVEA